MQRERTRGEGEAEDCGDSKGGVCCLWPVVSSRLGCGVALAVWAACLRVNPSPSR
jgi:hypothetical protein